MLRTYTTVANGGYVYCFIWLWTRLLSTYQEGCSIMQVVQYRNVRGYNPTPDSLIPLMEQRHAVS